MAAKANRTRSAERALQRAERTREPVPLCAYCGRRKAVAGTYPPACRDCDDLPGCEPL